MCANCERFDLAMAHVDPNDLQGLTVDDLIERGRDLQGRTPGAPLHP